VVRWCKAGYLKPTKNKQSEDLRLSTDHEHWIDVKKEIVSGDENLVKEEEKSEFYLFENAYNTFGNAIKRIEQMRDQEPN
jgi:hypothetical protein